MASRYQSVLKEVYQVTVNKRSAFTGIMMGAGFYYAISNNKYAQIPLVAIMPNVYAGYHGLKFVSTLDDRARTWYLEEAKKYTDK